MLWLSSCGAETLCSTTGFQPTPEPFAVVTGKLGDLPQGLEQKTAGQIFTVYALTVDGAEVGSTGVEEGQEFELELPPNASFINLRIVIRSGSALLKSVVPEVQPSFEVRLGTVGAAVTAHSLLAERSAEIERGVLGSMPPQVMAKVLANAAGSDAQAVADFRAMVRTILDSTTPAGEDDPAFAPAGTSASAAALERAGIALEAYEELRDRAAGTIAVPVVCDPARLRVLFTCDISGQALDGNGVLQFIRQPPKEDRVYLGITLDPLSPVADIEGALRPRLTPNDPGTVMYDDGGHGDEVAGDKVFSLTLDLPRGMRVLYKYMDGSAGEGFTGTEEWPGNARILEVRDLLTGNTVGSPDCVVVRRDSFGDESSNKNFVNLHALLGGGALDYSRDLGGRETISGGEGQPAVGGLALGENHQHPPLTPAGIPEARENGTCSPCPPPLTVASDDHQPPRLVSAAFVASDRIRATFSEDLDLASAAERGHYTLLADEREVEILAVQVRGGVVTLEVPELSPRSSYLLRVRDVADASADKNVIPADSEVGVGPDLVPPILISAHSSTITEINPAARPEDPTAGEVIILEYDEIMDRISVENVASYSVTTAGHALPLFAAYQRGRRVLLVTARQAPHAEYRVAVHGPFDRAGNMMAAQGADFEGLALYRVRWRAVVEHAFLSVDGAERGLPPGDSLYLTGTVLQYARALDGADLRVPARTDVPGHDGFAFAVGAEQLAGAPIHELDLLLPPGSYAWKVAHGKPGSVVDPPPTLETVSKNLCTRNDDSGVTIDPATMLGRDGISYAGARLSISGVDSPGQAVIFKRENPDERLDVGRSDLELRAIVVGTWRDRPTGGGHDYDDGRVELDHVRPEIADEAGPRLLTADAPCSAGLLLSFDEALASTTAEIEVEIEGEFGLLPAHVQYVGLPVGPTQVFLQTGEQFPEAVYGLSVSGVRDSLGNFSESQLATFVAPGYETPCQLVDETPPEVVSVQATRPNRVAVRFSERIHSSSARAENFAIEHLSGGLSPSIQSVLLVGGGTEVWLETSTQEIQAPYRLTVGAIDDLALPPNTLTGEAVDFTGFGELVPPEADAFGVDSTTAWVRFSEPVTEDTVMLQGAFSIAGLDLLAVDFSGAVSLRASAANPAFAPIAENQVILTTSSQSSRGYDLLIDGVEDLSGNATELELHFDGMSQPNVVDVVIEYLVSRSATVLGAGPGGGSGVPGRALAPTTLELEREGLFIRGTGLAADGATRLPSHPATLVLGGFPARGADEIAGFAGVDPELRDDGAGGDRVAGDDIYTVVIPDVPVGSTIAYKAFAPFSVAFRDANPLDARAALADATPGPSQYADGEEYPGNDNGCRILADSDGDGVVVIRNIFGDEVTYKRFEDHPVFVWVDDEFQAIP